MWLSNRIFRSAKTNTLCFEAKVPRHTHLHFNHLYSSFVIFRFFFLQCAKLLPLTMERPLKCLRVSVFQRNSLLKRSCLAWIRLSQWPDGKLNLHLILFSLIYQLFHWQREVWLHGVRRCYFLHIATWKKKKNQTTACSKSVFEKAFLSWFLAFWACPSRCSSSS